MAIGSSAMIAAGVGAPARRGTVMRWTPTLMIWRRSSKRSISRTSSWLGIPPAVARSRAIWAVTAPSVLRRILISAVPPLMLKTDKNPLGQPISVFDGLRAALAANRPQFYKDITIPFYGYNRPGAKISEGIREHWWLQGMLGGVKAHYDCIKAFSETDFTEDLTKIDIPVLVMHGDDDQIVPIVAAGPLSAKLLKNATLKVYPGFPHGMPATNADQINADLLTFFKEQRRSAGA